MASPTGTAHVVSHQLWARVPGTSDTPETALAAAEQLCEQLRVGLARWVGVEGYRALLARALTVTMVAHPALAALSDARDEAREPGARVARFDARAMVAGVIALVATLIELLGRIVGDEMAARLVEQVVIPSPRGVVSMDPGGADND